MKVGSTLTYLHSDHLGSTVMETNNSGVVATDEKYFAYGKQRDSGKVVTDHRFTGQKEDASGLQYFHARFYDPAIGMFISPDTIVPQPGLASDYNRYLAFRGNPLRYNDPSGHDACGPGANDYCDEYQKAIASNRYFNLSYDEFLSARQQYQEYVAYPELYLLDDAIASGAIDLGEDEQKTAELRTGQAIVYAEYYLHQDIEYALNEASLKTHGLTLAAAVGAFSGGAWGKLGGAPLERHHMPAKSVSGLSKKAGPAIQMDPVDHAETSSYGRGPVADAYRQEIADLINAGRMRDAMAMEIKDVRRVAGSKDNSAISEMLDYARARGWLPDNPNRSQK